MSRALAWLATAALLAGCATVPPEVPQRRDLVDDPLPAMRVFAPRPAPVARRSNAEMARDILALEFRMESGREVPRFTRFEGPVTVALRGAVPPTAAADLARLIGRLRSEAALDIAAVAQGPAAVTIEFLPRARLQALVPQAACFVVPNVDDFAAYRMARRSERVDWVQLATRDRVAIFIPSDTSPQEVRDCLHEELAQALGPLNDLYHLSDSVFNDDNFHTVLTGFDMLVLRVHYDRALRSGMTRDEVAAALPGILAQLNPAGQDGPAAAPLATPRAWIQAVETALGPRTPDPARRNAARAALAIAQDLGWQDSRQAFSHFAVGRLSLASEIESAVSHFAEAARIWRGLPGGAIHVAHVDMQMAAFALSSGQADRALVLVDRALPVVAAAENAALLATLLMIRAEALALQGRAAEARAARLDSLGWARYGFGSEDEVRERLGEIALLVPRGPRG